jgi:hypothetical protein
MIAQCSQDFVSSSGYDARVPDRRRDHSTPDEIQVLLPRGAFLVECSSSETGSDELSGRVEHIVSGKATSFKSAGKLIDFIRGVLAHGRVNSRAGDVSPGRHELDESD